MLTAGSQDIAAEKLLDRVLAPNPPAFALIQRPRATGPAVLDLLVGTVSTPATIAEIALGRETEEDTTRPRHEVLAIIPYRQIAERGMACVDDGSPLLAMTITDQGTLPVAQALARLPGDPVTLTDARFDVEDDAYADIVRRVVADEIGTGEGSNFVVKRTFTATITDYSAASALAFARRLLEQESGAYWTFVVHTGNRTFVGATPERHVSLHDGVAVMNPISGTYRYPPAGPTVPGVLDFLADRKEVDELYMVLDEELKMMARICGAGGRIVGPYLKEMTRLAHTEYFIEGHTSRDPREILRETMFSPAVTGSPLASACRVITRYEPEGRGYYSGVLALIGRDGHGGATMDSAILIRTADIDHAGRMRIGVGATLVRHSEPSDEVAETEAKAAGLRAALASGTKTRLSDHPSVDAALRARNGGLAEFWLAENDAEDEPRTTLSGRTALVVDAEDSFTAMIGHQLRSLGLVVTMHRFDQEHSFDDHDLIVMGPGPGDPRDVDDPRINRVRTDLRTLLARRKPLLAVCLSHQLLSLELGFPVLRRTTPNQGVQRKIDLFGSRELVGFYNTFACTSGLDQVACAGVGAVEVSRDTRSGEVHAMRGPNFASVQFHAESVLTQHGVRILNSLIVDILNG
ncbi:anthranilate synthase family protein [Pseudonocardia spinosispora]|uniref:anthranilate synthase family protein n=1 Tax=Pseudonocardia spinosispora TaxID=103441 RepID=UPI000424C0AE|nr:anthranilate synthase family protein [Pseudonocardia spinosispora]